MSKLNEKDTELYIHEKYIINLSAEENIFTDDVMKKIHHLSNGITDRIDFLCLQYLSDMGNVRDWLNYKSANFFRQLLFKPTNNPIYDEIDGYWYEQWKQDAIYKTSEVTKKTRSCIKYLI